ncbi:MAG: DUF3754 domain-containing protein [Hyphomonadaceae bacterium]
MADGYIPARRGELIAAMAGAAPPAGEEARFGELARILSAILHYEAHEALEELKDLYAPLDPDAPPARRATGDEALKKFEAAFGLALKKANFDEVELADSDVGRTQLTADLKLKTSDAGIRSIRFFARGAHQEAARIGGVFGLFKKKVEAEIVDDVIVVVAFKDEDEIERRDRKAFAAMRRGMRPGAVLVKHFRHVARAELITLHPGAKPTMKPRDQVFLAVPAVAGGVPVLLQLWPALTVLFTLLAIWFGARGVIENSQLQQAVAALSGLIAVGAFVLRQKMKYERQSLLYQKQLADTVYFRNLANNAGVLDALIGAGEEQDSKEALLAYWILLKANAPMAKADIDKAAEAFLAERFGLAVDFEIGDALGKLERLGLVAREGEALRAAPIAESLARLDSAWDAFFKYQQTAAAAE